MQFTADNIDSAAASMARLTEQDALRAVHEIYKDGIVSRDEAERLFLLQTKVTRPEAVWEARFIETISDHVLQNASPPNWVTESEADWLLARMAATERPGSWLMLDTLIAIVRKADGVDAQLTEFLLQRLAARCIADGVVSADEVTRIRLALFAGAGSGGLWINEVEADLLFAINDATARAENDPSWNDLFARMIANHIMSRATSEPVSMQAALAREAWLDDNQFSFHRFVSNFTGLVGKHYWSKVLYDPKRERRERYARAEAAMAKAETVTAFESAYVKTKIADDDFVSPAEQALLDFLAIEAPGFSAA